MTTNYIKIISKRPTIHIERMASFGEDVGSRQFEEYWFFDDSDPVSVNVALDKAQAFKNRQPERTRFQTSVFRPIVAARGIPAVGEVAGGMRKVAA